MATDEHQLFESLFRRYYKRVVSFVMHFGFSVEDARDLAQETFLRVYRNMDTYRGGEWVFLRTAAQNLVKNRFRDDAAQKRAVTKVPIGDVAEPSDPAPSVEVALATAEETARFRAKYVAAIDALPRRARECFLLREQGYSYEDIAAILRMPMNSVKSRLHETKRRLRADLGEEWHGIDWLEAAGERDERDD